ncbi:putative sulfate/molybdate transporter [Noviherbaspirillum massiliense]|uniref:putative sulfate/molybdate transporter n=1 Tax=Noviherbaspirillum massiliense TaxID=1465823 RepID=UPI0002F796C4|nr:putative sulfate/molybdate transporter [Noviherbaspirillum massiliense]
MKNETDRVTEGNPGRAPKESRIPRNRFDRMEWAGAFGDLGTLIPFVTAYIAVLRMDPLGVLFAFGAALIACGWFYRTPVPVQPMKAIGAAAATQVAQLSMAQGPVMAAGLLTGAFWFLASMSGLAGRVARWVPRELAQCIVLSLGLRFMFDGARMMHSDWLLAGVGLLLAVGLRKSRTLPAMFALLVLGIGYSLVKDASLAAELKQISVRFRLPQWQSPGLSWNDVLVGAIYLALPQIPLTLGNAIIGTREESNRLFPDRPLTLKRLSVSTGLMNLFSAGMGGVPMCHGAGGIAAHTAFGARTGGASIILGTVLIVLALCFSDSVELLLRALPAAVVGVILFVAGALLARGSLPSPRMTRRMLVVLLVVCIASWNAGAAFVIGWLLFQWEKRRC